MAARGVGDVARRARTCRRRSSGTVLIVLTVIALLLLPAAGSARAPAHAAAASGQTYVYDAAGRLKALVTPVGVAVYRYDAAGNIQSIGRQTAAVTVVLGFALVDGPSGTTVTIYGTAFAATPADDAV